MLPTTIDCCITAYLITAGNSKTGSDVSSLPVPLTDRQDLRQGAQAPAVLMHIIVGSCLEPVVMSWLHITAGVWLEPAVMWLNTTGSWFGPAMIS